MIFCLPSLEARSCLTKQQSDKALHSKLRQQHISCLTTDDEILFERCYQAVTSQKSHLVSFLSEKATFAYVDNCANTHICTDKSMYLDDYQAFHCSSTAKVSNIGGSAKPLGIGTVRCSWKDDTGKDHIFDLKNTRHFPDSPANILSLSQLGIQLKDDDDGTWIQCGV